MVIIAPSSGLLRRIEAAVRDYIELMEKKKKFFQIGDQKLEPGVKNWNEIS